MAETKVAGSSKRKKHGGRVKGTPNKTTALVKDAIAQAAEKLGGTDRLVAWAQEAPENERVFWSQIYTKLLPHQVESGPGGFQVTIAQAVKDT